LRRVYAVALAAVLLLGCFQHTYYANTDLVPEPYPRYVEWNHYFLWGLVDGSGPVNVDAICPEGVSVVHNETNVVNWLLTFLTAGIYAPTTVEVTCVQGAR